MLEYTTIEKKPITTFKSNKDGGETVEAYDLLAQPYNRTSLDYILGKTVIVNEYYTARPDLISLAVYGTDQYADFICKLNGISNPFELNPGTILLLPQPNIIMDLSTGKNVSPTEIVTPDEKRIQHKTNEFVKELDQPRTPNERTVGDTLYTINRELGLIFY